MNFRKLKIKLTDKLMQTTTPFLIEHPRIARKIIGFSKNNLRRYVRLAQAWKILDKIDLTIKDGPLKGVSFHDMLLNEIYPVALQTLEPVTTDFIMKLDLQGSIAIDAGASYGYYSMLLARQVGTEGFVYCFEPNMFSFVRLRKHIEINQFPQVLAMPYAISNDFAFHQWVQYNPMMPWYEHLSTSTREVEKEHLNEHVKPLRVLTASFDAFVASLDEPKRVKLVKVDVEGSEVDAIKGAAHLLQEIRPAIVYEISDPENIFKTEEIIKKYDYVWKTLDFIEEYYHNILLYPQEQSEYYESLIDEASQKAKNPLNGFHKC